MTSQNDLHPQNIPGRFFVNRECVGCDHCSNTAPNHFSADDELFAFVARQPVTPEEIQRCEEVLGDCPANAIGKRDDGSLAESTLPRADATR